VVACPYQARHLVPKERYYFGAPTAPELATYDRSRVGICTKCHFCFHKFDEAPPGAVPGRDPEYTPSCSSSCIADAILFGDLNNPESRVGRLLAQGRQGERMLEHLDTQPSVYYLNAPRMDPLPPRLQHSWHRLAVANFFAGPTGAGLYLLATLWGWRQGGMRPLLALSDPRGSLAALLSHGPGALQWAGLLGPALVAVGLLSVAAEAGRPLRGFNVLRNVRRSWMSRESAFALVFMALATLDTLLWASPPVQLLAALSGMGLVLAQGVILSKAKGVPAWNVPIMPLHFVTSGLTSGAGALLVLLGLAGSGEGLPLLAGVTATLVALDLLVWYRYLATPARTGTFAQAVAVLRRRRTHLAIVGIGHWLPLVLLALTWSESQAGASFTAGVVILIGGWLTRSTLIRKAGFVVDLFDRFGLAGAGQDQTADRGEGARPLAA
jgi:DMSO reductase anchor subunit